MVVAPQMMQIYSFPCCYIITVGHLDCASESLLGHESSFHKCFACFMNDSSHGFVFHSHIKKQCASYMSLFSFVP